MDPVLVLFFLCLALGAVVGVFAGLLGIGGGLMMVPALTYMLANLLDIGVENGMPIAIATSLSTVIFTGLSSARTHFKFGNIDTNIVTICAIGIAIGSTLGAVFASQISGLVLQRIFAVLVILIALQMSFGRNRVSSARLAKPKLIGIGLGTGFVSSLMGIGGGAILVPVLVWFQVNIKKAIGCAALCGVVIALFGTVSFIISGWNKPYLPDYSLGYVFLPATLGVVLTSMVTAPMGAKLTAKLDVKKIKRIFALLLVILSIRMIIGLE